MDANAPKKRLPFIIAAVCILLFGGMYVVFAMMKPDQKAASVEEKKGGAQPTVYVQTTPSEEIQRDITSIEALNDIAVTVIDYALAHNYQDPDIDILSNNGAYATASLRETEGGNDTKVFLVKRQGKWNVIYNGNGLPSCQEIATLKATYGYLPNDFLTCAEER